MLSDHEIRRATRESFPSTDSIRAFLEVSIYIERCMKYAQNLDQVIAAQQIRNSIVSIKQNANIITSRERILETSLRIIHQDLGFLPDTFNCFLRRDRIVLCNVLPN